MVVPLVGGLSFFGIGEGLLVASHWGAAPWTVFAQGVSRHLAISLGWATALISGVVLLAWWPLRERPGVGTLANLAIIAFTLDVTAAHLTTPQSPWVRGGFVVGGVLLIGLGSALYLTCGLGPGPRDGLMTSLHRRFGVSVVYVRVSIEVTVLVIGYLMGGVVGVGTAVFALSVGFSIGMFLRLVSRLTERRAA